MTRKRVAILISGGGSNMAALLDDMARDDHPARAAIVISSTPQAGGLQKAEARGVKTAIVDRRRHGADRSAFESELDAALRAAEPDIICLAGFMRVLSADFVSRWAGRMLNIHPSLLPKFRGLDTHARAIAAGETRHGCTVHEVTAELDGGPIQGQASLDIAPNDTAESLAARVLDLEHRLYPAVLRRFASGERGMLTLRAD